MEGKAMKKRIQTKLLQWFQKNKRDLPWRKSRDPYAIWVSEIMLQQTQVKTVIPYYKKFLESFPTLHHLARADLSKVLKVWEGLGYYTRARNLYRASQIVLNRFHGRVPKTLKDLLSLPGIGRSTAGAILSIGFNQEAPILDGNVKRVLSRLFALSGTSPKTGKLLWRYSASLIPKGHASSFNQALMDLGATICTPKDPLCSRCPLKKLCLACGLGNPERYPSRFIKKRIPHIESIAAVIQKDGKVLLNQRPLKGLLGGLWEFPNWKMEETSGSRVRVRLKNHIKKEMKIDVEIKEFMGTFKQTFSHFKLTLDVFKCKAIDKGKEERGKWVCIKDVDQYPMARIFRRIAYALSTGEG